MNFKFFKNQMSLPLRSIAIGTFLAFAGGLFINSSSNECKVFSTQEETLMPELNEKNKIQNTKVNKLVAGCVLIACPLIFIGVLTFSLLPPSYFSSETKKGEGKRKEEENKGEKDVEEKPKKDKNGANLTNNSSSARDENKGKEDKEKVLNGGSSSRIAGIAAVSAAVGVGAASGAAVSGINKLVNSNKIVNAKVKVGEAVNANKVTDDEGALEKAKDFGDDESNETKNSKNIDKIKKNGGYF